MESSRVPVVKITILPDRTQALFFRLLPFPVSSGTKVYLSARIYDIECYLTEVIYAILFAVISPFAGVYKCGFNKQRWRTFIDRTLLNPHRDSLVGHMPRLRGWGCLCAEKTQSLAKTVADGVEDVKGIRFPLFTRTPAEAAKLHEASQMRPKRPVSTTRNIIRLEYFSSLEKGRYRRGEEARPEASMDLYLEKHKPIDLSVARKAWGLESLAIITDAEPFRVVFDLATEDRLSPLAAYDLSKQLTRPIRVFEPRVGKMTTASRTIRGFIYPALFFIFTLVKLLFGFPEKNTRYLCVLYGGTYTAAYERVGKGTVRLRGYATETVLFLLCLPFMLAYYSIWVGTKKAAKIALWSLTTTRNAIGTGLAFAFSLQWRTWLIVMLFCWYALAEYHGSRA